MMIFFIILVFSQGFFYAWIATLKVMQHANGHIIRLAGDIHLEGCIEVLGLKEAMKEEENFLITIEKPLASFLAVSSKESECLVIEKIVSDLLPISYLFQDILEQCGIAAIPFLKISRKSLLTM